ncbi:hypothetical protein BS329_15595 [Amycolatopsis coloradensis]|uniref:Uncharacterized protein n=1 Tax=Amycolatopsis coloradensis TaxID=76021 RepID=A0A1R0KU70_9PSEU|nr:hypothetical protein [Amycolatopsis coloradensis]OLZ51687.1 hypothetical protein BS329_15595 [Amycolatopsis coloradensis]
MDMKEVSRHPGKLRRTLMDGHSVPLSYHDNPYATAIPTRVLNRLLQLAGNKGRQVLEDSLLPDDTPGEAVAKT